MRSGREIVRVIIAVAVTCIVAASAANAPPDEVPPVQYWDLPTHSRVAYLKFSAIGERRAYPIVFLHGGPGAYVVSIEPTTRVLSQLRQDGFDVYVYDQVGGGLSQRLTDITQYTVGRHVADLEAIRRELRAEKLILIGSSWGATLAARYIAEFAERVDRVIFAGPGALHPAAWRATGYGRVEERFTSQERAQFQALVNRSDLEQAMELLTTDPAGALRAFPHAEGDRLFDEVTNRFYLPHLGCAHSKLDVTSKGYGFWANRMTSRDLDLSQDPAPALRHSRVRALILRGECEYMKRAVAEQYRDTFSNSDLVDVPGAGHMIYWDQPAAFLATVRSFLR
jgi:pimeloyl-ACP methyl ester carboxylesterase